MKNLSKVVWGLTVLTVIFSQAVIAQAEEKEAKILAP